MIPGTKAGHGMELRGLTRATRSSTDQGRFGRLFRWLPPAEFTEEALKDLAATMAQQEFDARRAAGTELDTPLNEFEGEDENPTITSGYTYLGQFVDHDITFDPISTLESKKDPDALHNFRTPRLDLDSMYGMGPSLQPYLYEADGIHLVQGAARSHDAVARHDLPRNAAKPKRALIGDKRNDENLIVSQLHAAFIHFHNAVADKVIADGATGDDILGEVQEKVRWHYQWLILHDFLPKIVGEDMAKAVTEGDGGLPKLKLYNPKETPFMPVEFSVAAYRFGHSMVRPSYALNTVVRGPQGASEKFHRVPIFSSDDEATKQLANLNGFRELPGSWTIDWSFFFKDLALPVNVAGLALPQPSYRIDTLLVDPLTALPEFKGDPRLPFKMLAFRNLMRGWRLQLPSGQKVAKFLRAKVLTDDELFKDRQGFIGTNRMAVLAKHKRVFRGQAPLWYYILKEAELTSRKGVVDPDGAGHHLGPVGGQIVAEVLTGLIWHDKNSYLRLEPNWKPTLGSAPGVFGIKDVFKVGGLSK